MNEELTKLRDKLADKFIEKMTKDQKFLYKPKIAAYISFCAGFDACDKEIKKDVIRKRNAMEKYFEEHFSMFITKEKK